MSTLDQIKARADGLTDLCPEYLRQSIRHVQRNCDINCNVHEADPYDHDCKQPDRYDGDRMAAALADIPQLLAAVEAVTKVADAWESAFRQDRTGSGLRVAYDIRNALAGALGGQA